MSRFKEIINKISPFLIVAGGIIIFIILKFFKPEVEIKPIEVSRPLVEVLNAYPQNLFTKIRSQGTIKPSKELDMTPQVSGKIIWISDNLKDGGSFSKDDILLRIDKRDYELALISSESNLFQARASLEKEEAEAMLAKKEWGRIGKGKASSLTLREPQLAQARALLAAAEASSEQAKRNLNRTSIRAPFDGRVREKLVDVGTNLFQGGKIANIYSTDSYEVKLAIADKDLPFLGIPTNGEKIDKLKKVEVYISANYGGETINASGYVSRVESEIDPRTRMISIVSTIPNKKKSKIRVGMFVQAEIEGSSFLNITVIPRSAVKNNIVWVVLDGALRKTSVEVLRYEDDLALIRDGFRKDDKILITKLSSYIDGMLVKIK
tara:strand:+ start:40 stop:1176 length:1137 start_codon:yes stop_codon:yes gene_type:complete